MSTVRKLPESAFQEQVLEIAGLYGWLAYHTYDSRRSAPGFPDLVLVRAPELIFAELKTDTGRLNAPQREWIAQLEQVAGHVAAARDCYSDALSPVGIASRLAVEVFVWRPADFDEINARLSRRERARAAA